MYHASASLEEVVIRSHAVFVSLHGTVVRFNKTVISAITVGHCNVVSETHTIQRLVEFFM